MAQETITDVEPPPIPPNGFPDDESPAKSTKETQPSKERTIQSHIHTESEQNPSIERASSPRNRLDLMVYENAARQYDLEREYRPNEHVRLPGKPKFVPKGDKISWKFVRYAKESCSSCNNINKNRPNGEPELPCLASPILDRCVFCHCTKNMPSNPCNVRPSHETLHSSVAENSSQTPQQERNQRQLSHGDTNGHAKSSLNDNRSRRYSEQLSREQEHSRFNDQTSGNKRKRSDRDEGSERGSSLARKEADKACIQTSSDASAYESPTQNDTPSTSAIVNGIDLVVEGTTVDTIFSNVNTIPTNGGNHVQTVRFDVVQASTLEPAGVNTGESSSTTTLTPLLEHSDDDDDDEDDGILRLNLAFQKVVKNLQLKRKKEKQDSQELAVQLQERYNRINKDVEKFKEENEKLAQDKERLQRENKKLKEENDKLKHKDKDSQDAFHKMRRVLDDHERLNAKQTTVEPKKES